ncbi:MAG: YdeI/OmpD-associated family protein [Saprospiraceae bacterium]
MSSTPNFTFSATLFHDTAFTPRAQGTILPIPAKIAKAVPTRPDRTRRVNVAIENLPVYQAKVAGTGRGEYFVPVNKQRREWLEEQHGPKGRLKVILTPDTSKYGLPVPPAFEILLAEDALVCSYFDDLTGGVQRRILFGLSSSKRESTQLHRAVATAEYLVEVQGKVDLKELARRWRLPKVELR